MIAAVLITIALALTVLVDDDHDTRPFLPPRRRALRKRRRRPLLPRRIA